MTQEQEQKWAGDELDQEDLQIPEIKLIQATGGGLAKGEGAEPGDFHSSLTGEVFKGKEGFDMVVVRMAKQRTYWGRSEISDEPPECASLQVSPMGGQSIFGDDCSVCSRRLDSPGAVSVEERRKGCTIGYNILAIVSELPYIMRPSGISAGAAKELYTQLKLSRELRGQWYRAKTRVTSVAKTTPSGEAFGLRFAKLELITDEKVLEFNADYAKQLLGAQLAQIPQEASSDGPVAPEPEPEAVIPEHAESIATEETAAPSEAPTVPADKLVAAAEKTAAAAKKKAEKEIKIPAPHPKGCQCEVCKKAPPAAPKEEEIDMNF